MNPHVCGWNLCNRSRRLVGKIPNTFKQTPPKEPPSLFSTFAGGYTVSGRERIRFQVFPSCVIVCDMRKKTKERQVSLRCVLEAGRGRRNLVAGHKRYPAARNIHLLFPASPSLTCGRKRLLRKRAREETREAGVDVAAPPRFGVKSNPQSLIGDPCFWEEPPPPSLPPSPPLRSSELTFEGEANPRGRLLQAAASADTQGQQEESHSGCCHGNSHAGGPQRSKSGREESVRQREGGREKKREIRKGMNYYYRAPHEKWQT